MRLRRLNIFGIVVTILYLSAIVRALIMTWPDAKSMPLNNWGDFLAGAMAPLAFLWLVLGYFQQSEELKQNTEALRLQADQLKQQVQETKLLVQESSAQAAASARIAELQSLQMERAARIASPEFTDLTVHRPMVLMAMGAINVNFRNVGGRVTHMKVLDVSPKAIKTVCPHALEPGNSCSIECKFEKEPKSFQFRLVFNDAAGQERVARFSVQGDKATCDIHP